MDKTTPAPARPSPDRSAATSSSSEASATVRDFLEALSRGDSHGLRSLLADDVWLRALLVREVHECRTAEEAVRSFRDWVGCTAGFRMIESDHRPMAGRVFLRYRFLVRPPFAPDTWHLVEQAGFCKVEDGRIHRLDLACTGYFPANGS